MNNSISYKMHVIIKIMLAFGVIASLNSGQLLVSVITAVSAMTLLFFKNLRLSWLKAVSKVSIMMISYLALQFLFNLDIELAMLTVGRLFVYLMLLVWIKETSTIDSFIGDMDRAVGRFEATKLGYKLKKGIHYLNFYIVSTLLSIDVFMNNYKELLPQKQGFIKFFIQVFLKTMLSQQQIRYETERKLSTIHYRDLNLSANSLGIAFFLALILINIKGIQEYAQVLYQNFI